MSRPSAYFVGDGTLLIRCAEALLEIGGQVAGVVSASPQIIAWAQEQGHALLGVPAQPDLPPGGADYLFSVANLSVLGPDALAAARLMAINFHDGPLPERGGLNTPAWAILEGADEHAVTWHEMLAAVVVLAAIGLILFGLVLLLARALMPWQRGQTRSAGFISL